ncbi:hypothetical protein [Streptomyces sp. SLBN-8D4]
MVGGPHPLLLETRKVARSIGSGDPAPHADRRGGWGRVLDLDARLG